MWSFLIQRPKRPRPKSRPQRSRVALGVELLEDRIVLSSTTAYEAVAVDAPDPLLVTKAIGAGD